MGNCSLLTAALGCALLTSALPEQNRSGNNNLVEGNHNGRDGYCEAGITPMQLHLAYAGDKGMTVSWNTYSKVTHPTVYFGRSPDRLDQVAVSDVSVTYETSTTYNNHVKVTGLQPDTLYYYLPQCSNTTVPYTMKTLRQAGDSKPFTVAMAADLGLMGPQGLTTHTGPNGGNAPLGPNDTNTIQSLQMFKSEFDFLWHREYF